MEYNNSGDRIMIEYITATDAAEKWGISHRRVTTLCAENRIKDAALLGNMWIIPLNAEKPADGRTLRFDKKAEAKPFLKWAGGKSQILQTIRTYYPEELGAYINKYCEPMVGGGAVLFDILNNYDLRDVLICDSNPELINTYKVVRDKPAELIELLKAFENKHLNSDEDRRKEYYYSQRDLFNNEEITADNSVLRAALFIYLNKTCFNGLYRVNHHGKFNVPVGDYKNPLICDEKNLTAVSNILSDVEITTGDFTSIEDFADEHTFLYFDPPYRPLSKTAEFTAYTKADFNDSEQKRLADFIIALSQKGSRIIASNSDPHNINPDDNFFDELYGCLNINRISAKRSINSNGSNRGNISELLICNY